MDQVYLMLSTVPLLQKQIHLLHYIFSISHLCFPVPPCYPGKGESPPPSGAVYSTLHLGTRRVGLGTDQVYSIWSAVSINGTSCT